MLLSGLTVEFQLWQFIVLLLIIILIAVVATFFVSRRLFQKTLKENPPMSEAAVRAMMTQMGRTPSEKQVRAVMRSMNGENEKSKTNKK